MRDLVPGPPDFRLDWDEVDKRYAWVRAMVDCPQNPVYHAEGDVWIHTRMVLQELLGLPTYRSAPHEVRVELFLAALLHDVAKPVSTQTQEDGRITARGHSRKGMAMARHIMWHAGIEPPLRERVAHMVGHHQLPMWCIDGEQPERRATLASLVCRNDRLAVLAEADMRGRVCADQSDALERIAVYAALAEEAECLTTQAAFSNEHSRLMFCRKPEQHRSTELFFEPTCEMTIMCGLPGSGKSTWIQSQFPERPVVSLDTLRSQMNVAPDDNQGQVVQAGKEQARVHLRAKRSFVWDATNLTTKHRAPLIQLGLDYGARVEVIHIETTAETARARNADRERPVPSKVMDRMTSRWQPPTLLEAHAVRYIVT